MPERSKIYFLQAGADGPIKIGRSLNPERRVRDLAVSSPLTLTLIGLIDEGPEADERSLHKLFEHENIHGEWFEPSKRLTDFINYVCQNFDRIEVSVGKKKFANPEARRKKLDDDYEKSAMKSAMRWREAYDQLAKLCNENPEELKLIIDKWDAERKHIKACGQ